MKKLNPDFPVFVIENFNTITPEELEKLTSVIIANKAKHRLKGAASFWLMDDDEQKTFTKLYDKFEGTLKSFVKFDATTDNIRVCNVYHSTKDDYVEIIDSQGRPFYHNHKHVAGHFNNATTIAAVYYMNITDENAGPIDFRREYIQMKDGSVIEVDKDLNSHQLAKRKYDEVNGLRETLVKEISYQPKTGDLVIFPAYLDHRPHVIKTEGHRIAVNFELKTVQHPDDVIAQLDEYVARNKSE